MQVDIEVQETEVGRLDPETASLALAFAGVVNVQAVIRPAMRRTPASVRGVRARAPRSCRLLDLPLICIWTPVGIPVTVRGTVQSVAPPDSSRPGATVKWYHPGSNGHLSQRALREAGRVPIPLNVVGTGLG